MTLIVAIQLEDSIIVAADNRITIEKDNGLTRYADVQQKIHHWPQGMISGAGETCTLERVYKSFQQHHCPDKLPLLLEQACQLRRYEIGHHDQLDKTRIIYSQLSDRSIRLYTVAPSEHEFKATEVENMSLELFIFNADLNPIYSELIELQRTLRNWHTFDSDRQWMSYYMAPLQIIFQKYSAFDDTVSASFSIYFQNMRQHFFEQL